MSNVDSDDSEEPFKLQVAYLVVGAFFIILSIWRIVFQGLLETPSFQVEHYDAGAGDLGLIVQFFLAVPTFLLALAWLCLGTGGKRFSLVLAALVPIVCLVTARGLQRFAPGYTEKGFETLRSLHRSGHLLTESDVRAKLGDPLMQRTREKGIRHWLYSYMPSCGYGWDKKHVFFDRFGQVISIYTMSEP